MPRVSRAGNATSELGLLAIRAIPFKTARAPTFLSWRVEPPSEGGQLHAFELVEVLALGTLARADFLEPSIDLEKRS